MTNREKYQRTFSTLHASSDCIREVKTMKKTNKIYMGKIAAVCAAAVMVLALAGVAYAEDVGGIQRTVQIWLHGEQTDVVFTPTGNGEYTLTYTDENGVEHHSEGGGVALHHGHERPLTEEELMEEFNIASPQVEFVDDGTAIVYYKNQVIVLTDFDEDGFCYTTLNDGERDMYLTIKYQRGWALDCNGFNTPKSAFQD